MVKKAKETETVEVPEVKVSSTPVNLGAALSRRTIFQPFEMWIVGSTPLIVHAWSQKAKLEMLGKQTKATKPGKEARDPERDFVDSLYEMEEGNYGFPATGVKNCILSSAHKDKGIARSSVLQALFVNAEMVRARPALAGAICD